ncbi:MAG: PEP-CTERM sorting domain-containing protein [Edaphobacter sp.]
MRRLIYLFLLVLFVGISATCVNASTDCERWFVAYRRELAHTRSLQRAVAAKRRAKLYAQRKLAGYVPKPAPKLVPVNAPRMTRKQTLHHFELACGVLPDDESDVPLIAEETPADFRPDHPLNDGLDLVPTGLDDTIAENDVPPPPSSDLPPDGGGPPVYSPPFTGGPIPPGTPPPPPPPDVPEPSTCILMLTGLAGAAGAIRSRFRS